MSFTHYEDQFVVSTRSNTDLHDITEQVLEIVVESSVSYGIVVVFTPGSTASVTTIEFESGAVEDLRSAIEKLAPTNGEYLHNLRWGDGNGYSHVRAALLGPSLSIPLSSGNLVMGTWQQIVLCDFDNVNRQRKIHVTVQGMV